MSCILSAQLAVKFSLFHFCCSSGPRHAVFSRVTLFLSDLLACNLSMQQVACDFKVEGGARLRNILQNYNGGALRVRIRFLCYAKLFNGLERRARINWCGDTCAVAKIVLYAPPSSIRPRADD